MRKDMQYVSCNGQNVTHRSATRLWMMDRIPSKEFSVRKYGRNSDVDGAADVSDVGSTTVYPTVAFQTEIFGGASDIPSSDGIHSVQCEGLDINGVDITEVATLNGTTPVVLVNSYFRMNRMFTKALGAVATQLNSFNIVCRHTGSATLSMISAQKGQTLQAYYTTPANISAYLKSLSASAARVATKVDVAGTIEFQTRQSGEGWRVRDSDEVTNGHSVDRTYGKNNVIIAPFSDVRVRVTSVNTNNIAVSAAFRLKGHRHAH